MLGLAVIRKRLTRYRFSLVQQLASEKVRLSNIVYLKASAYMTVKPFSDMFGATSQQVLNGERTVDELAALPTAELAQQLQAYGRRRFAKPAQSAGMLKQVVAASFLLPDEMVDAVDTVLHVGLAHIGGLGQRIASLDEPIATAARELPGYEILRTIPGIGPVYAAGLVAEIGEVGRFLEGSKRDHRGRPRCKRRRDAEVGLAKLAGLYWPRKESGEFKGEDRHMSKRGNVYLRYYLIQAANSVRVNDPTYAAFYARKYREAVRHKHRRALVLTARKLVRLIFAMLHDEKPYQAKEVAAM